MITKSINKAKKALINENIVAIPTETVYGLAGNAFNENALKKIFILKRRPFYNPLIIHIKSIDFLKNIAHDIPKNALKLAENFWPGPLTLVLKKQSFISDLITAGKDTVAIRVPNHTMTLSLLNKLDFPLAAPSANPFGSISPTKAEHVLDYFKDKLDIILNGGTCKKGIESTIVGFQNNQPILYRHGSITIEELEFVVGKVMIKNNNETSPSAPGMLSRHYAPKTTTYLATNVQESIALFDKKKIGLLLFKNKIKNHEVNYQEILSKYGNLNEAAANLYNALHRLDKKNLDIIIAERLPNNGLGKALNDKLKRASKSEIN